MKRVSSIEAKSLLPRTPLCKLKRNSFHTSEIREIRVRKAITSEHVKAECDNFIFKTRVLTLNTIQLSEEGEGVRHEIRVIKVRKVITSEY